jgi:6-phosphogluconolactonase
MAEPIIHVSQTPADVAEEAGRRLVEAYEEAMSIKGRFSLALAGGSTPKLLYQRLSMEPLIDRFDWAKVHIFFSDERCVPPDHADSNYRMAREAMLQHLPIPLDNVYRMRGEADPAEAAAEYDQLLQEHFADAGCDVVLLGMGDDGHTASLFPGTAALNERQHRCAANFVPRLNAWRLTMTAPFINRAWQAMILVTGAGKAHRVAQVLEDNPDPAEVPIALIKPELGKLVWLLDAPAAGMTD